MVSTAPQNESSPEKSEDVYEPNDAASSSNDPDYVVAVDDVEVDEALNVKIAS